MHRWWKKLRGLVGLTSVGGILGAMFGGIGTAVTGLLGGGVLSAEMILLGAGVWGGIAAVSTAAVGVLLAVGGPRESLADLSAGKAGLFGIAVGAAAPFLLVSGIKLLYLGVAPTITLSVASSMVIGAALCGSLGAGLVVLGKKADSELIGKADQTLLKGGE